MASAGTHVQSCPRSLEEAIRVPLTEQYFTSLGPHWPNPARASRMLDANAAVSV